MADKLGVVESCYANWEQGRTEPSIAYIRMLTQIFNVSLDDILTDVAKINECSKNEVKQLFYKMYKRTE